MKENNIPKHWKIGRFEDVLDYIQPTKFIVNSTDYDENYKTPVLTAGKSFIIGRTNETEDIFNFLPVIIFDDFTTAIQFVNFPFKVKSSAMKILKLKGVEANIRYVYYYMQTVQLKNETHKRYWISEYSKLPLPLPPLPEQHLIVSKIEELFSELDKGIENLKTAQQQLKVYRQAVLKWAFEGKLTNSEVISEKSELSMAAEPQGNYGNKELPEGWKQVQIKDIAETFGGYAFKSGEFQSDGKYQVLRMGNIRPGLVRYAESPVYLNNVEESILTRALLQLNDVIITQTGTRKKRDYGFTVMIQKPNLLLNQRIAAIRFKENYLPKFFLYFSWTDFFKDQFFANETGNVGQGNVGMKAVTETLVPLCTIKEQKRVVDEIESRLTVCDKMEETIINGLQQSEALRQSILKKAFEGKLI